MDQQQTADSLRKSFKHLIEKEADLVLVKTVEHALDEWLNKSSNCTVSEFAQRLEQWLPDENESTTP